MNSASACAALALLWLAALAALHQQAELPPAWPFAVLALLACVGLLKRRWPARLRSACLLVLVIGLALAWGSWRAAQRLAERLAPAWEGRDLIVEGRIDSLPQPVAGLGGQSGWRFAMQLESVADAEQASRRLQIGRDLPAQVLLQSFVPPLDAPAWRACERWQLRVRLRQPHGLSNPQGFDYELWMFEQGLGASGLVRAALRRQAEASRLCLDGWRQDLREAIQREVKQPRWAALLTALSLGDQAAISRSDWALFRDTGIAHLVSISGMHVTMFAWLLGGLAQRWWRRWPRACLALPAPLAGLWCGVAAAALYAAFSGWGVPSQRTVWMLLTLALLRHSGLRWPWPLSLLVSAVVVTALDPWALCQAGFWLSFVAVGLLLARSEPPAQGWRAMLASAWRTQWAATLGLAPLSLLFFGQLSLVGLLANALAIPLVSFVIAPLSLLGALLPWAWQLAGWASELLLLWLRWLASWPWAVWWVPTAAAWAQGLGLLGAALCVLPLGWRLRMPGFVLLLPLLWPALEHPAPGQFELLAPDVGQGTAVLVRTAHHALLYDSGPQWSPDSDAGQRVLLPLLRGLGVQQLDILLLSHRDLDHVGGAASLLGGLPAAQLLSSLEREHPLQQRVPPTRRCEQGQQWLWDGVHFEILHPQASDYEQVLKPNAMSCVLRVRDAQGASALLTGDLEAPQEMRLLQEQAQQLRSTMLLMPHHGSKTSSTEAFIAAVAPQLALAQAGYRNRFGHPAPSVLARYQSAGVPVQQSPDCGAWHWRSVDVQAKCQRSLSPRYWQAPAQAGGAADEEAGPPWP